MEDRTCSGLLIAFTFFVFVFVGALDWTVNRRIAGLEARISVLEKSSRPPQPGAHFTVPGIDPVPVLATCIARLEGYPVPGSLPNRQHNPGSLVYAGQPGARRGSRDYAVFPTPRAGWAALERDLRAKLARGSPLGHAWPYLTRKETQP